MPSNYIQWLIKSSKATVIDLEEELCRRGEWTPVEQQPPISPSFWEPTDYDYKMYEEANRLYEDAGRSKTPGELAERPDDIMVFTKKDIETLVAHSVTHWFNDAYNRLSVNIQSLPYTPAFKDELLSSLYENRPIDVKKFKEYQKTTGGSRQTEARKNWHSEDHRK